MRVLLVEDDSATAQGIELMLKSEGFNFYTTDLGEEGIDLGKIYDYDLILLDLNMPLMDGISFLRLLRRHMDWSKVPVVVMTAMADKQNIESAGALGVRDYMLKAGFSLKSLRSRIGKYLEPVAENHVASAAMIE